MKKLLDRMTNILPLYGIFPLLFSLGFNCLVYMGSRLFTSQWHHYNIETALDLKIPFLPEFLIIYFGCYLFWVVNYILIARQEREQVYRFFTGDFLSRCVCLAFYLLFPTTNTRPLLAGNGFWEQAAGILYTIDAPDNLLPSIHCLVSWFCYLGIRGRKDIPLWYQRFSMFFAILVFASTLFTKQHVVVDVVAGLLLAELCFYIGRKTNLYRYYAAIANRMEGFFFQIKKK